MSQVLTIVEKCQLASSLLQWLAARLNVVPFPILQNKKWVLRDRVEIKIKVKGNGQECPFHTSIVGFRDFYDGLGCGGFWAPVEQDAEVGGGVVEHGCPQAAGEEKDCGKDQSADAGGDEAFESLVEMVSAEDHG